MLSSQRNCIHIPAPLLTGVTSGKLLTFPRSWFPHLWKENQSSYFLRVVVRIKWDTVYDLLSTMNQEVLMMVIESQNEVPNWESALSLSRKSVITVPSWSADGGHEFQWKWKSYKLLLGLLPIISHKTVAFPRSHNADRTLDIIGGISWNTQQYYAANGRDRDRNSQEMYETMHLLIINKEENCT